jgi:hypothetical protein
MTRTTLMMWAALVLFPAAAAAQDEVAVAEGEVTGGSGTLPTAFSQRSMTLPRLHLRIDLAPPDQALMDSGFFMGGYTLNSYGITLVDDSDPDPPGDADTAASLGIGAGFGILDELEVGMLLFPVHIKPGDFGDMQLYGRYRFLDTDNLELGVQLTLQFPTWSDFGLGIGMPLLLQFGEIFRLDFGVELEFVFNDEDGPGDDDDAFINLDLPIAITINVTENIFLGPRLAIFIFDFDEVLVPIGGFVGGTIPGSGVLAAVDIHGSFLFYIQDDDNFTGDVDWRILFGANFFLDFS